MKNLKIRTRLLAAFSFVIVLTVLVGAMGFIGMTQIQQKVTANGENVSAIIALETIRESQAAVLSAEQILAMTGATSERQTQYSAIATAKGHIEEQVKLIEDKKLIKESEAGQWQEYLALETTWLDNLKRYLAACMAYETGDDEMKKKLAAELFNLVTYTDWGAYNAVDTAIAKLVSAKESQSAAIEKSSQASAGTWMILLGALLCGAIVVAALMSFLVSGRIGKSLSALLGCAESLANGNTQASIGASGNDEVGKLNRAFGKVVSSIRALTVDIRFLMKSAEAGELDARADASAHKGEYGEIVEGINGMLGSITAPVTEAISVLSKVCVNDLTMKIEGSYNGDMKVLSDAVNETIDRTIATQEVFVNLSRGDMSQLPEFEAVGRRSENDLMIPSVIQTMRTLNALALDAGELTVAAAGGNLDFRGDAGKYEGKYSQIIEGINGIVDAITQPLHEAMATLQSMAGNDFTVAMGQGYAGAFAELSQSINTVAYTLSVTLGDISSAAEQVASGTRQVSAGAQALSQGATEQAGAIEQLTASLSDIAEQTKNNAVKANQASELAYSAKEEAVDGNARMNDLQQAMNAINDASANISKIIRVIDDIAFQTNLLALNAAVEAARAGQHGRGFAVVAEEVRNLAQRSAEAARETTEMIEESINRVKAGTAIADETAEALIRIVSGVEKATELVGSIARQSADQATAVAQVNSGVGQVSEVTQTNSATAEESAAASEELSSQAALLREMVGRFNLNGSSRNIDAPGRGKGVKALPGGRKGL